MRKLATKRRRKPDERPRTLPPMRRLPKLKRPQPRDPSLCRMDKGAYGWMVKYAKSQYPRVASADYNFEDLLQEGFESYYEVLNTYPAATDRPHIQALFQLVFRSHIERRVRKKCHTVDFPVGNLHSDDDMPIELHVPEDEMSTLTAAIARAPAEVKAVLQLFTTETGRKKLRAPLRASPNGYKETFNDRLLALTGYDMAETTNLIATVRNYLAPEQSQPLDWLDKAVNLGKATAEQVLMWALSDPELSDIRLVGLDPA